MAQHIISYLEPDRCDAMGFEKVRRRTTPASTALQFQGDIQLTALQSKAAWPPRIDA